MSLIQAVILDWAGTTVDQGSMAPVRAIQRVFERQGIAVADADARREMGLPKREHLRGILERLDPGATARDLDALYADFMQTQPELLAEHSAVIAGVVEAVAEMRRRGVRIGSTTGYSHELLDVLFARARAQGYEPDCAICPEEAGGGRPHPYMMYLTAARLQRYPLSAFVKVGDTPADIAEGKNAGSWTVGVSETGNSSRDELRRAGAHFVIDSVAVLGSTLDEIERRLSSGDRP
jgi:phosphonoacetaldehyde hydrolase